MAWERTCIIDSVTTPDNVNYIISLNADTEVYENSYVQITANVIMSMLIGQVEITIIQLH